MNNINLIEYSLVFASFVAYALLIIAAASLPLWGYKLIENRLNGRHKALRVSRRDATSYHSTSQSTSIIASVGTTTAGVFLIQVLPLIFSVIGDVGADFNLQTVYGDYFMQGASSDYVSSLYGVTAQLGDILQTTAPLAAVGLGGYNLLNNISRGLPA